MVLTAILDCLVSSELDIFIHTLTRDGIRCLSSDTPLETLHDQISTFNDQPIVIYGASSLQVPYDDCPRLWLCCGPEIQYDEQHATWLLGNNDDGLVSGQRFAVMIRILFVHHERFPLSLLSPQLARCKAVCLQPYAPCVSMVSMAPGSLRRRSTQSGRQECACSISGVHPSSSPAVTSAPRANKTDSVSGEREQ